jgi:hypothetical protein
MRPLTGFSRVFSILVAAATLGAATPNFTGAEATTAASADAAQEKQAFATGVQAVIYGLPLVLMDVTMKKTANEALARRGTYPANQFAHLRQFPTATFKNIVRANVDTLYSSAFVDLSAQPVVLSVPDTDGRYYLAPIMDAWTNVIATPGTRTTGNQAGSFVISGPGWSGALPAGLREFKSPTNMIWILGRTQTNGPEDFASVHAIQDGFKLVPLSSLGRPYVAPESKPYPDVDPDVPPVEQVKKMDAATFFGALARLLKSNPPPESQAPMLSKLAAIGIVPGEKFDLAKLNPSVAKGLETSVSFALEQLQQAARQTGAASNAWRIPPMTLGNYGTAYPLRAVIALVAFGANLPADAVYPTTYVDAAGSALNGANRYTLHFDPGQTPPVNAFWSVTLYNSDSYFVANAIDRYAISSWMPLQKNPDGSIDLYIQRGSPGNDKEPNWLPCADGDFNLTLRMYWPKDTPPSIMDGSWKPPPVMKVP